MICFKRRYVRFLKDLFVSRTFDRPPTPIACTEEQTMVNLFRWTPPQAARHQGLVARCYARAGRLTKRQALTMGCAVLAIMAPSLPSFAQSAPAASPAPAQKDSAAEQITVTATRRSESVAKVPLNVTALSQTQMDQRSIRNIDDLANLVPDITFTHTSGVAGNNATDISIRGIFSDVGSPTTAIYIDDTPVSLRNIGYWSGNVYPKIFDLDRVEVLRGPQGTLFGDSAEGGAVRFITAQPSLTDYSGTFKAELADGLKGDPTYETGIAYGGPIIYNQLGFRASAWYRSEGGYINRVSPDTGAVEDANANTENSAAGKIAFTWKPIDELTLIPSLFAQSVDDNDRDQYWASISNPDADQFNQGARTRQPAHDKFILPGLKASYDFGFATLLSNTSFFDRDQEEKLDYSTYVASLFDGTPYAFPAGDFPSQSILRVGQRNLTEDARLQSDHPEALIDWTIGLFYSSDAQHQTNLTTEGQTEVYGFLPPLYGKYSYDTFVHDVETQIAGYADVDVNITSQLKLIGGVRISNVTDKFLTIDNGPLNGGYSAASGNTSETPVTPKFGISYQLDSNNFLYATAAEGFRTGGAQAPVPTYSCGADLASLGLTGSPTSYNSDSLWSYELGSKNNLLGGRLRLDSSVYYIDWRNIQQTVRLPECGLQYVANLGSATSIGGDTQVTVRWTDAISTGTSLGYSDLTENKTIYGGSGSVLAEKGQRIGGPPLNASAWASYNFVAEEHASFLRVDYAFHSRTPTVDPQTFGYDPTQPGIKSQNYVSVRVGTNFGSWSVQLFANNATNNETAISVAHDIPYSPLYYNVSYRPTTIGIDIYKHF
jgi:outer membrane receptor protein involved in Fe transport